MLVKQDAGKEFQLERQCVGRNWNCTSQYYMYMYMYMYMYWLFRQLYMYMYMYMYTKS